MTSHIISVSSSSLVSLVKTMIGFRIHFRNGYAVRKTLLKYTESFNTDVIQSIKKHQWKLVLSHVFEIV